MKNLMKKSRFLSEAPAEGLVGELVNEDLRRVLRRALDLTTDGRPSGLFAFV